MARGWESKTVEAQIEDLERGRGDQVKRYLSPDQVEIFRKKEGLLLSLTRVQRDLETSRNPRYQAMLREARSHLERELSELEKKPGPS